MAMHGNKSESNFHLRSDAVNSHREISIDYTSEGKSLSPPLAWSGPPIGVQEFTLVCEEETPSESQVIWLVYRIPPNVRELPEGIPQGDQVATVQGVPLQGVNSSGRIGYTGPMPPLFESWHHYTFKLYALDTAIRGLRPRMTRDEIFDRMKGHILAVTTMMMRYKRQRKVKQQRVVTL